MSDPERVDVLASSLPFVIVLVGNGILVVYLVRNDEAWEYFMVKIKSYKEQQMLDSERRKLHKKRKRNKVFPLSLENISQDRQNLQEDQNEMVLEEIVNDCVIDMENVGSDLDETSM